MNHFSSKQDAAINSRMKQQIRHERYFWIAGTFLWIFLCCLSLTGCGGSDIGKEDVEDMDGLVCFGDPLFDGPCAASDRKPIVYKAPTQLMNTEQP